MGIRTELAIDGDRCRRCGSLLALQGITLDRRIIVEDGMAITMYGILCRRCFAVADIPYWGEILPSERTLELFAVPKRNPCFASAPTLRD